MKMLIIATVLLFVLVLIITRVANKQAQNRRSRNFKTNYYNKKKK